MSQQTIFWPPPAFPGGRHLLKSGCVALGAVFPPASPDGVWQWRLFWFGDRPPRDGTAKDFLKAQDHLLAALSITLEAAALQPTSCKSGGGTHG